MDTEADRDRGLEADVQNLSIQLENRTFVDYFNTFLCLPVFGQHVYYNFRKTEFLLEPRAQESRERFLDQREVLRWLCRTRLPLFKSSPLYTEYKLCMHIQNSQLKYPGIEQIAKGGDTRNILTENILGHVVGMLLFRESMRGTCGERVFRCWKDIEAWRQITDPIKKTYWKHIIKKKYINQHSKTEMTGRVNMLVYHGVLNFDLVPQGTIHTHVLDNLLSNKHVTTSNSDEAFVQLHALLLNALTMYWVPRHVQHVLKSMTEETRTLLQTPVSNEYEYLHREKALRCKYMFPTLSNYTTGSSATAVFTSRKQKQMPRPPSPLDKKDHMTGRRNHRRRRIRSGCPRSNRDEIIAELHTVLKPSYSETMAPSQDTDWSTDTGSFGSMSTTLTTVSSACSSAKSTASSAKSARSEPRSPCSPCSPRSGKSSAQEVTSAPIDTSVMKQAPITPPIVVQAFLYGKQRFLAEDAPNPSNRILWSLASDILAGRPFLAYLQTTNKSTDDHVLLRLWADVRNYLDATGPVKKALGLRIVDMYLSDSRAGYKSSTLEERVKKAFLQALGKNDDGQTLLVITQDIIVQSLVGPWRLYVGEERADFLEQVLVKVYDARMRKKERANHRRKKYGTSLDKEQSKLYFFRGSAAKPETPSPGTTPPLPPVSSPTPPTSATSRDTSSTYNGLPYITEHHMCRAMELTILCCDYGTSMVVPHRLTTIQQLAELVHSRYGSLHVFPLPPTTYQAYIPSTKPPPKVDIETVKVSRKMLYQRPDLSMFQNAASEGFRETEKFKMRRGAVDIERPEKPLHFEELLTEEDHFEFFKRFMILNRAGCPLNYWTTVEALKKVVDPTCLQVRIMQTQKKFFGRFARYGQMLECNDEIIRQIARLQNPTLNMLVCAQQCVYKAMEKKWYNLYILHTYSMENRDAPLPVESKRSSRTEPRKKKKKGTGMGALWTGVAKNLLQFTRCIRSVPQAKLFEIYLRCEAEKEHRSDDKLTSGEIHAIEKNILSSFVPANMYHQTRLVVRNRLIVANRLATDLHFWCEISKYQEIWDSVHSKDFVTKDDLDFMAEKIKCIISRFIFSEIPPKLQVNLPAEVAVSLNNINPYVTDGPKRGLFHDAVYNIFPVLYHYWIKYSKDWMNGCIPHDYVALAEYVLTSKISDTPHAKINVTDFTRVTEKSFQKMWEPKQDDNTTKIHFSIHEGISYVFSGQVKTSEMRLKRLEEMERKKEEARRRAVLRRQNLLFNNPEMQKIRDKHSRGNTIGESDSADKTAGKCKLKQLRDEDIDERDLPSRMDAEERAERLKRVARKFNASKGVTFTKVSIAREHMDSSVYKAALSTDADSLSFTTMSYIK